MPGRVLNGADHEVACACLFVDSVGLAEKNLPYASIGDFIFPVRIDKGVVICGFEKKKFYEGFVGVYTDTLQDLQCSEMLPGTGAVLLAELPKSSRSAFVLFENLIYELLKMC